MTNTFGSSPPTITAVDIDDAGPLQLGHAFVVNAPCVVTHMRYYVASLTLDSESSGSLPFYIWLDGDPDSTVTGTLTIPTDTLGWVAAELSPHLFVPAGRYFGAAVHLPSVTPISYGYAYQQLPARNKLLVAQASGFSYSGTEFDPYDAHIGDWALSTSYLIDVEVAVSEMVNLAPSDIADGDTLQIKRTINGTVNTGGITPITAAYMVNVHVTGGPLDGEDIDVWVPDTVEGIAAASMVLLKELPDPDVGSRWQASDTSLWVYQGGGVYVCFAPGIASPEGSKTTRADTPSLVAWTP